MGGAAKSVKQGFENFGTFFDPTPKGAIAQIDRGNENSVLGQYGYKADPLNKPLMEPEKPPKLPALEDQLAKLAQLRFSMLNQSGQSNVFKSMPATTTGTPPLKGY